jgi:hypothetical protein
MVYNFKGDVSCFRDIGFLIAYSEHHDNVLKVAPILQPVTNTWSVSLSMVDKPDIPLLSWVW